MAFLLLCSLAFLIGSIPSGLIIGKLWLGQDIRTQGSGNIGMTNVMRVGGKGPGIATFLADFGKGAIAVGIAYFTLVEEGQISISMWTLTGLAAILGHVFSVFLKFKGGKGVATTFGVLAVLSWPVGVAAALLWIGTFLARRISSLSALVMLVALPFLFLILPPLFGEAIHVSQFFMFFGLSTLLIYKHRENIQRLLQGEEKPLGSEKL